MLTKRDLLRSAAMAALAATTAKSTPAIAQNKAEWPSLLEAKDIAEEGFIYGLPLVMNYAVMHEFAVDRNSGQFKAPFNEINNMHHVATPADTAVITPNSDTPYSIRLAGSARRTDGDLGAGGGEGALLLGPADRRQYLQLRLHRHAAPRAPSRATIWWSAPTGKARRPPGIKKVFRSTTPFAFAAYPHPALQSRRHAERREGAGRLQGAAAFRLPQATRPARRAEDRFRSCHHGRDQGQLLRVSRRRPAVRPARRRGTRRSARSLRRIGIGPGKTFEFKDLSLEHKAADPGGHEAGRRQGRQMAGQRKQEHQRLERRLVLWRRGLLQRRLADAGRGCQGRSLRQRCRGSHVPLYPNGRDRRDARRQQAQLHASPSPPASCRR